MRTEQEEKVLKAYIEWIKQRTDAGMWVPFTITCVFKSQFKKPNPEKWLYRYKHKVLWKINKRLYRRAQELVFHNDCFYEFEIKSLFELFQDKRTPHHIHGYVCVDTKDAYKVWNYRDACLNESLDRSFGHIRGVESVLMQPMCLEHAGDWINYTAKKKDLHWTSSDVIHL